MNLKEDVAKSIDLIQSVLSRAKKGDVYSEGLVCTLHNFVYLCDLSLSALQHTGAKSIDSKELFLLFIAAIRRQEKLMMDVAITWDETSQQELH